MSKMFVFRPFVVLFKPKLVIQGLELKDCVVNVLSYFCMENFTWSPYF
jgi:hypothetical protein